MRVNVPCRKKIRSLVLLLTTAMLIAVIANADIVSSQGTGGVGVGNDGPSFVSIEVEEDTDIIFVHVALRDLNGWDNIFLVNVTVMDSGGRPISQVIYRQYRNPNATTPAIEWEEIEGSHLNRAQSSWQAVGIYPWNPDYTTLIGLNVSFAFNSFPGDQISVIALDKGVYDPLTGQNVNFLSCDYLGPFSAEFTAPPIISNYVVPLSISLFIALAVAAFLTLRRHYSNKLAKAIETKEAAAAED